MSQSHETLSEEDSWATLGLTQNPFSLPTEDGVYLSPLWQQHLELIQHLSLYSNVLLSVEGADGIGRYQFIESIVEQMSEHLSVHVAQGDELFNTDELLQQLTETFQIAALPSPEETHSLIQLEQCLNNFREEEKSGLLIIDNAQKLDASLLQALKQLVRLQVDNSSVLHLVLVGDVSMTQKIQKLFDVDDEQELMHGITLEPLAVEEVRAFIDFYLQKANYEGDFPFDDSTIQWIHAESQGLPRRIPEIVAQCLLEGEPDEEDELNMAPAVSAWANLKHLMGRHKVKISALLLLIFVLPPAVIFFNQRIYKKETTHAIDSMASQQPQQVISEPSKKKTEKKEELSESKPLAKPQKPAAQPVTLKPKQRLEKSLPAIKPAKQAPANAVNAEIAAIAPRPKMSAIVPAKPTEKKQAAAVEPKPLVVRHEPKPAASQPAAAPAVQPKQPSKPAVAEEPKPKTKPKAEPTPKANKVKPSKPKSKPKPAMPKVVSKPKVSSYTADEKALLKIPASYYTLQVIGVRNAAALTYFKQSNKLGKKARIYKTILKQKPWYVLVYGQYATKSAAKKAVAKLPRHLRKQKPWPKPYSDVHQAIRKAAQE